MKGDSGGGPGETKHRIKEIHLVLVPGDLLTRRAFRTSRGASAGNDEALSTAFERSTPFDTRYSLTTFVAVEMRSASDTKVDAEDIFGGELPPDQHTVARE